MITLVRARSVSTPEPTSAREILVADGRIAARAATVVGTEPWGRRLP